MMNDCGQQAGDSTPWMGTSWSLTQSCTTHGRRSSSSGNASPNWRASSSRDSALMRSEISFRFAKYFRIHAGADNLLNDPDWSFGFSIEWEDPDIRSLAAVAATGQ